MGIARITTAITIVTTIVIIAAITTTMIGTITIAASIAGKLVD